jgi:beta-N-acetylhexosaminidase
VTAPAPGALWPDRDHHAASLRLARQAVTLLRDRAGLLPLAGAGWGVIEFTSGGVSPVEAARNEPFNASTLALLLSREAPDTRFLALDARVPGAAASLDTFLSECSRVVVATRRAHLDPAQADLLARVAACGKPVIQLALRGPYDADLAPRIGTVLLTYGDQPSAIVAVVDVLLGRAVAPGRLPIRLSSAAQ